MKRPLGSEIAAQLAAHGVTHVFGVPGVHNLELYRGLEGAGITHVLARNEQGAGFMADGYARASGRPGVVLTISGPGLTNALTPLGQAYSDSVPVLALSSCLDDTAAIKGQLHQMRDQAGAANAVCDWSETARDAEGAFQLVARAFAEFACARPRPKHVNLPIGLLSEPADPAAPPRQTVRAAAGPRADDVARVAAMLVAARRPIVIAGGGARGADLAPLLARSGAAAFTTYAGRGILGRDHPMNFGSMLARPTSADVLASADLVLALGTELAEVDFWRDNPGHGCPLIRVDIDPLVLADRHAADHAILADAALFVAALTAALDGHAATTDWRATEIAAARRRWRAEIDADRPGIGPVADALQSALPADTVICSDMTSFAYAAKEIWDMAGPGLWHHPTGFGTLGFALPAAIGAGVALPEAPVVAIAGDYGFQYTLQELATAAELGRPLPILIWDNGKLGEIEANMIAAQIAPIAVSGRNPDWELLARAYGIAFDAPGDLGALADGVAAALKRAGPTLIRMTAALGGA